MVDFLVKPRNCRTGVVAFASGGPEFRHEIPAFEWQRTLDALDVGYVLLRDSRERWWQDGVVGIGDTAAVIAYLRGALGPYRRRVALGLSSGAFAALQFGWWVPVDEVIAISPVTMLGPAAEQEFPEWMTRVRLPPHQADLTVNLRASFAWVNVAEHPEIRAYVSDGDGAELDAKMCHLIGVTPTVIPGHSHADLARHMRDTGLVQKLLLGEA